MMSSMAGGRPVPSLCHTVHSQQFGAVQSGHLTL
jgi:hypothetical protein